MQAAWNGFLSMRVVDLSMRVLDKASCMLCCADLHTVLACVLSCRPCAEGYCARGGHYTHR